MQIEKITTSKWFAATAEAYLNKKTIMQPVFEQKGDTMSESKCIHCGHSNLVPIIKHAKKSRSRNGDIRKCYIYCPSCFARGPMVSMNIGTFERQELVADAWDHYNAKGEC